MRKILLLSFVVVMCCVSSALALSDREYRKMMSNSEFRNADSALNKAYMDAKNSLSPEEFNALKKSQAQWIRTVRDNEAKQLIRTRKMNRVKAYTQVTLARAEYVRGLIVPEEADTEEYYEPTDDGPDDVPDDVPGDVPDDDTPSPSPQSSSSAKVSSAEEAAEYLDERLTELEKIMPTESLEYSGTTDIDGETCWEFSSRFNFNETGRYAVNSSGKIYEYDGEKYNPVK